MLPSPFQDLLLRSLNQNMNLQEHSPAVIECHVVTSGPMMNPMMMGMRKNKRISSMMSIPMNRQQFLPRTKKLYPEEYDFSPPSLKIEEVLDDEEETDSRRTGNRPLPWEQTQIQEIKKPSLPSKLGTHKDIGVESMPSPTTRKPYQIWGELQPSLYSVPISEVYKTFLQVFHPK